MWKSINTISHSNEMKRKKTWFTQVIYKNYLTIFNSYTIKKNTQQIRNRRKIPQLNKCHIVKTKENKTSANYILSSKKLNSFLLLIFYLFLLFYFSFGYTVQCLDTYIIYKVIHPITLKLIQLTTHSHYNNIGYIPYATLFCSY